MIYRIRVFLLALSNILLYDIYSQTYVHIVTDRDDIYKIARIYGVTPKQISKINALDSITQPLLIYQKLIIPDKNYNASKQKGQIIKTIKHIIQPKESLYSISRQYGITVFDILELNPNVERGKVLDAGDVLKIQVTANNRTQYSQQIIYLNGEQIHFDSLKYTSEKDYEAVKRLNDNLFQRITEMNDIDEDINLFDSFNLPEHDTTAMSRWIYNLIVYGNVPSVDKTLWLDSMYEELFYVKTLVKKKAIQGDIPFLVKSFKILNELNQQNPSNDHFYALRSMLYYWIHNQRKSDIFLDEAIAINAFNETAQIIKAVVAMEEGYLDMAFLAFRSLLELKPKSKFIQYNIASIHYYKLEYSKAIEIYSQLLPYSPELAPEINFRIGHCYLLMNDDVNGCEYIREAEKLKYKKATSLRMRNCAGKK